MNLFLIGIVAMAACFIIGIAAAQMGFRKHRGVPRDQFIAAFADTSIPSDIPATVYDFYKERVLSKNFVISPDDSYEYVMQEAEEDIADDSRFLIKRLGFGSPPQELWVQWAERVLATRATTPHGPNLSPDSNQWMQPIQTVRDMIFWLDWVRQHQEHNAQV